MENRIKFLEDMISKAGSKKNLAKIMSIPYTTLNGWIIRRTMTSAAANLVDRYRKELENVKPETF